MTPYDLSQLSAGWSRQVTVASEGEILAGGTTWSRQATPCFSIGEGKVVKNDKPSGKPAAAVLLGMWALFVINRAMHPLLIDLSKGADGKLPYQQLSPVIAKCFLSVLICNVISLFDKDGWRAGLRKCYAPESLRVFSVIGMFYALGDCLEMRSMSSMDGAAYQVLLQSKLMMTALLMRVMKGPSATQSPAQWSSLVAVTLGMSMFMLTQSSGATKKGGSSNFIGVFFALCKVLVSCYCAVSADASLKKFKEMPLYAQLSQLMGTWGLCAILLAAMLEPASISPAAFFEGWNGTTMLVVASFAAKSVLTMTLLKILDSVQKNIGEAVAVLVIYFSQVFLPMFNKHFETNTFLAMMIVVVTVTTYMLLKQEQERLKAEKAKAPEMRVVRVACEP